MTIIATVLQDDLQAGGTSRNILAQFDDDVDGSTSTELVNRPASETAQGWADGRALELEAQRGDEELNTNFRLVSEGVDATTLVWVRNTVDVGDEYICKGASNQVGESAVLYAHIHREYSNPRIVEVTGLSNPERQAWSGDAQALETACNNYKADHTDNPIYFFDGFPGS